MGKERLLLLLTILTFLQCEKESDEPIYLDLLSIQVNGIPLTDGATDVGRNALFELAFSERIDPNLFGSAFRLQPEQGTSPTLSVTLTGGGSRAQVQTDLLPNTTYTLQLAATSIAVSGSGLENPVSLRFTTAADNTDPTLAPCTSASSDCTSRLTIAGQNATLSYFRSFPLEGSYANQSDIRVAIIAVHGQNRNADDYFRYLTTSLQQEGLSSSTVLISPRFAETANANQLYWSSSNWREGQGASGPVGVSSFQVMDELITAIAAADVFPNLERIVLTGHSSGAAFTHLYATASEITATFPELNFEFVVANSQYFYYPLDLRYETGSGQFVPPTNCADFNHWPYGFERLPNYLDGRAKTTVDEQLITRSVTYLLGTEDIVTTGTLNTRDCEAVLLGANRLRRGELIHELITTRFPDTHQHALIRVEGVGHNAQRMYESSIFREWLADRF